MHRYLGRYFTICPAIAVTRQLPTGHLHQTHSHSITPFLACPPLSASQWILFTSLASRGVIARSLELCLYYRTNAERRNKVIRSITEERKVRHHSASFLPSCNRLHGLHRLLRGPLSPQPHVSQHIWCTDKGGWHESWPACR